MHLVMFASYRLAFDLRPLPSAMVRSRGNAALSGSFLRLGHGSVSFGLAMTRGDAEAIKYTKYELC